MRAIVLSAGLGTRFRPATELRPKALLPYLNVPLLDRRISSISRAGLSEIAVNLHHEGRQIVEHLEERAGERAAVRFFWEPEILGTAGALKNAGGFLTGGDFLVWNVDAELDPEIGLLQDAHRSGGAAATLLVVPNPDPRRFTPLHADGDRLVAIGGPGDDPLLFTGVSIHSPDVLDRIRPGFRGLVEELWNPMLERGETIRIARHRGEFFDLGTPADLLRASRRALASRQQFEPREGFFDGNNQNLSSAPHPAGNLRSCVLGRVRVSPSARLEECVLWDGADVEGSADLRRCLVGPVRVPEGTVVHDAMLWPGGAGEILEIPVHDSQPRSPAV